MGWVRVAFTTPARYPLVSRRFLNGYCSCRFLSAHVPTKIRLPRIARGGGVKLQLTKQEIDQRAARGGALLFVLGLHHPRAFARVTGGSGKFHEPRPSFVSEGCLVTTPAPLLFLPF